MVETEHQVARVIERARGDGRRLLLESESFPLVAGLGVPIPSYRCVSSLEEIVPSVLEGLPGKRIVLKMVARDLAHKTERHGVAEVEKSVELVRAAARVMMRSAGDLELRGFLVQELVPHDRSPGGELLVSMRWDREFGPVLACGLGGQHAEFLARALPPHRALAQLSLEGLERETLIKALTPVTAVQMATAALRGRPARLELDTLISFLLRLGRNGGPLLERGLDEIELNPIVIRDGSMVALDALVRPSAGRERPAPARPSEKMDCLLRPRSIAVIGASRRRNPGHLILENILRSGFDSDRVYVVKPGLESLLGCRCFPELTALPEPIDLLVVAVAAGQVSQILHAVVASQRAESVILIPGGLEGSEGVDEVTVGIRDELDSSRSSPWGGPIVNGGNCMGIRSAPGRYDTFFLPEFKLPVPGGVDSRVALVAQSGAFLAAKTSKLAHIPLRYSISVGNQIDVTVGDYLRYLSDEDDLDVIGVYIEGFRTLDGRETVAAARRFIERGGTVVLYRAGRNATGAQAAASHTASMAGSYELTVALARQAGILVADTLDDFEDLLSLAVGLAARPLEGPRLAALSNAGFECVAFWDRLDPFQPARLAVTTIARLREILSVAGVDGIVEVRNPLDVTPMVDDELFSASARALLADDGVDLAVIGCVPLTGALNTLPAAGDHQENVDAADSVAGRLIELWHGTTKPWVVVVDAGSAYDHLVDNLRRRAIPTFRNADRALRMLAMFTQRRS